MYVLHPLNLQYCLHLHLHEIPILWIFNCCVLGLHSPESSVQAHYGLQLFVIVFGLNTYCEVLFCCCYNSEPVTLLLDCLPWTIVELWIMFAGYPVTDHCLWTTSCLLSLAFRICCLRFPADDLCQCVYCIVFACFNKRCSWIENLPIQTLHCMSASLQNQWFL